MPEETRNKNGMRKDREEILMPDFSDLWKEMYFKMEETWANAVKEVISTKTFVDYLDKVLEYNLNTEKVIRQSLDKYMEHAPVPSKKDVARVAELVISMEEKIDVLEFEFLHNFESMAESLLKMVKMQEKIQEEIGALKEEVKSLMGKLTEIEARLAGDREDKKAKTSRRNEKKAEKDNNDD